MINSATDKPILNLTAALAKELGLDRNDEIESYREKIPDYTFFDCLDELFDLVPFSSNKHFATYNNFLIDIRVAKKEKLDFIELLKNELEDLKVILEKAIIDKPQINRKVAFLTQTLDNALNPVIVPLKK